MAALRLLVYLTLTGRCPDLKDPLEFFHPARSAQLARCQQYKRSQKRRVSQKIPSDRTVPIRPRLRWRDRRMAGAPWRIMPKLGGQSRLKVARARRRLRYCQLNLRSWNQSRRWARRERRREAIPLQVGATVQQPLFQSTDFRACGAGSTAAATSATQQERVRSRPAVQLLAPRRAWRLPPRLLTVAVVSQLQRDQGCQGGRVASTHEACP